ncbi:sugar fermentation stimulation protein A [Clostridium acetireducens DSM 10703]|jgi:sugar fermentation stimulation protein A|uniref:Sugar fermentation stimulation protein homolog n=1 Tax=Clostridium acetireducens DSM 10703 TaxID=1121290 RepID=A0A1E8EX82_9CLOT|nr:DNA/RNA nuclease SfsA [Clostridium acetireducens]OFI04978.1 sugar fermentation stimulation protein A [Clostridium acetireducens DSM 10703]
MVINKRVIEATFLKRPNRFQAYVNVNGEEVMVHVPNTGRCKEILIPGCTVILREENSPLRKTKYDLIAGYKNDKLINIDSQIPNKVVEEALKNKKINKLIKYNKIEREKTFKNSRFDFKLEDDKCNIYYLEVKGVTYEYNGLAKFPDAPTDRGRKHILELIEAKKEGAGAGILFLIQMENVKSFSPFDEIDLKFGNVLRNAEKNNIDIFAYNCSLSPNYIELKHSIPIFL